MREGHRPQVVSVPLTFRLQLLIDLNMDCDVVLQAIYYHNGEARAEYLFKKFGGAGVEMYFAGRWSEYQKYQISEQIEERWAEKWGVSLEKNHETVSKNVHEAYEFLSLIMKRPGMFVGRHRLDLAQVYFDGWRHHQRCMWDISYDMECWLFQTEGVSFTGSILAWSLFYAYFGAEDVGVNKFREFLADTIPTSHMAIQIPPSITSQIGSVIYSFERENREFYGLAEYCDFAMGWDGITEEQVVVQVLCLIRRLIPEVSNPIKIYINSRSLYCQVRFFFCQDGEWVDGIDVCTEESDVKRLVVLHAYLHKVIHWHKNQIVIINSEGEQPHWEIKSYEAPHHLYVCNETSEELLMYWQFEQWYKEQI